MFVRIINEVKEIEKESKEPAKIIEKKKEAIKNNLMLDKIRQIPDSEFRALNDEDLLAHFLNCLILFNPEQKIYSAEEIEVLPGLLLVAEKGLGFSWAEIFSELLQEAKDSHASTLQSLLKDLAECGNPHAVEAMRKLQKQAPMPRSFPYSSVSKVVSGDCASETPILRATLT